MSAPDSEPNTHGEPKPRQLGESIPVSLNNMVPKCHYYGHLDRMLDLTFVLDLVRDSYVEIGLPWIDPVVIFRLQLILFFEGLRSESRLIRVPADRLCLSW